MERKSFGIAVVVILVVVGFAGCIEELEKAIEGMEPVNATVIINFGNETVWTYENITTRNNTVYGFLLEAAQRGNFTVSATYQPTINSVLIDSIAGVENGQDNKYWQYWVNEDPHGQGQPSLHIVNDNDIIEWKFVEL